MSILATIGIILLTLVGYSMGTVMAARDREFFPAVWDLLLLLALWVAALALRPFLGESRWFAVLLGLLLGLVVGFAFTQARLVVSKNLPAIPVSELPAHARDKGETAVHTSWWHVAWAQWAVFGARLGAVQGRLLMGFFYFIFVTPFAIGMRLASDPLHLKKPTSGWSSKEPLDATLDVAREQG